MSDDYRTCHDCRVEIVPSGHQRMPEGARRHAGRGLCSTCHRRRSRAGTLGEVPLTTLGPARERTGAFGRFQLRRSHLITSLPGATGLGDVYTTAPAALDPATATRAALTVAAHSRDADECREFLAMLGIEVAA